MAKKASKELQKAKQLKARISPKLAANHNEALLRG